MSSYQARTLKSSPPIIIFKKINNFNPPELFCKILANFLVNRTIETKLMESVQTPPQNQEFLRGQFAGHFCIQYSMRPEPKKSLLVIKEGYRSEINTYFADDNIIMTSGKQGHPPKVLIRANLVTNESEQ